MFSYAAILTRNSRIIVCQSAAPLSCFLSECLLCGQEKNLFFLSYYTFLGIFVIAFSLP